MSTKLWTEEQFNCPVCLELPNDPVTIPCGHSYCMACIKDYWSKDDPKGIYSCPQCRKTFCPKPSLSRNTMLAEAVEQLRKSPQKSIGSRSARGSRPTKSKAKLSSAAVQCDMCKSEPKAAVKSCLVCMSSFCEAHLKPHQTKKTLKQHELIAPTSNLSEKICTQHKYLQEFFCRQCKSFICWLCTSDLHKGHDSVSTKTERLEKQKLVSELLTGNQQKLKEREQELKDMKKMMEGMRRSTDKVHTDMEKVLEELQRSVERLEELLEEALDQANQDKMSQAEEITDSLEAEIKELKKRGEEMKDLSCCEDHIHYLQTYESMCSPLECGDLPVVNVNPDASFDPVMNVILDLREQVEDMCNQELGKITKQVNDVLLFTLGDSARNGHKGGLLKLFSGLGSRSANSRSPSSTPTLSSGSRGADRRGIGAGYKSQDVRSRETSGNTNPPRRKQRRDERERESVRETNLRPSPSSRPSSSPQPSPSLRPSSSPQPSPGSRPSSSPRPSPTPSRKESHSLWSRSSQMQPAPAQTASTPAPAATPAPSGSFSRMASISSLFRSHRRGMTPATPVSSHTQVNHGPAAGTNPWGVATLPETPTEINPGLFLDSPSPTTDMPAFPALREINLDCIQAPEPRSRDEFLQYAVSLILDPNTAHRRLVLSEGNTKATLQGAANSYPDTAQRFDGWTQVMCQSPIGGPISYWEVEWRGRGSSMGVSYGALTRKGADARAALGYNAQSWTLELSDSCCSALHDNNKRDIPVTYSPRVGVYLDTSAGTLDFYSVEGTMTHLHTFRANFTQPLYAVFGVGTGVGSGLDLGQFSSSSDSIKICPM